MSGTFYTLSKYTLNLEMRTQEPGASKWHVHLDTELKWEDRPPGFQARTELTFLTSEPPGEKRVVVLHLGYNSNPLIYSSSTQPRPTEPRMSSEEELGQVPHLRIPALSRIPHRVSSRAAPWPLHFARGRGLLNNPWAISKFRAVLVTHEPPHKANRAITEEISESRPPDRRLFQVSHQDQS